MQKFFPRNQKIFTRPSSLENLKIACSKRKFHFQKMTKRIQLSFESKSSPLSAEKRRKRVASAGNSLRIPSWKEGVEVEASQRQSKFAVEFHVLRVHHRRFRIWCARQGGGAGWGQGVTVRKRQRTSLKCQRHHNSRGAKGGLLAVPEPATKKGAPRRANKTPFHGPLHASFPRGGGLSGPFEQGTKGRRFSKIDRVIFGAQNQNYIFFQRNY